MHQLSPFEPAPGGVDPTSGVRRIALDETSWLEHYPVLSLGATRRFLIRPRDGGASVGVQPADGDLVVMGGRAQVDWRHCVPKRATAAGPRASINFAPGCELAIS